MLFEATCGKSVETLESPVHRDPFRGDISLSIVAVFPGRHPSSASSLSIFAFDLTSSFTCICLPGLSSFGIRLTTTAQCAYKAPDARTYPKMCTIPVLLVGKAVERDIYKVSNRL